MNPMMNLPPEVAAQLQALQRRQQMAQMLQQQAFSPRPTEMMGSHAVRQSPLGGIARALTGYVTGRTLQGLDKEQAGVMGDYSRKQGEELAMLGGMGDPKAKISAMLASSDPVIRQMGLKAQAAAMEPEEYMAPVRNAEGNLVQFSKRGSIKDSGVKGERKLMTVGKEVLDEADPTKPVASYSEQFGDTVTIDGDRYQQIKHPNGSVELKKLDNAPKVTNTTNVQVQAEKAFDAAFGGASGKSLAEGVEARPGAINAITSLQKAQELLTKGIYTGMGADWKKALAKGGNLFGLSDGGKAARTEQFMTELGEVVLPRLKDIGGNDTKEEREYIERTVGGQISMEPEALAKALASAEAKIRAKQAVTEQAAKRWRDAGKTGVPTVEELPAIPAPVAPAVPNSGPTGLPPPPPGVKWIKP